MSDMSEVTKHKFIPGSDAESNDIFKYPFTIDDNTIAWIKEQGQIMVIIRGPPGTGKDTLSKMLADRYTNATICSADSYFRDTFSSSQRDPQNLRRSHEFCHKKVETACQKNKHPIIVKNTHMKKLELQKYLDFAAEYNYTVIMAETIRKFEATPEILAQSNTKGLSVEYFQYRLRQWEEVIPILTGWFMSPDDSSYLLKQLQGGLDSLLGDGKFCRILNAFEKGDLFKLYRARKLLYCIAACGENYRCHEIKSFYLSNNVQEYYGQCFSIVIQGYLVTPSFISAVVYLNETMKSLCYLKKNNKHKENDMDLLHKAFSSLDMGNNLKKHSATVNFDVDFKSSESTVLTKNFDDSELINVSNCRFIQLVESSKESHPPIRSVDTFFKLLDHATDEEGIIQSDKFIELNENCKVCRLSEDAWLIRPPFKLSFKTIYTGLYV